MGLGYLQQPTEFRKGRVRLYHNREVYSLLRKERFQMLGEKASMECLALWRHPWVHERADLPKVFGVRRR